MVRSREVRCRRHQDVQESKQLPFSDVDEKKLVMQFQKTRDFSSIGPIVKNQIPAIRRLARQGMRRAANALVYDDLVGAGVLGAINALHKFDPKKNDDFSKYADSYIKTSIKNELDRFNSARVPRHILRLYRIQTGETCTNCPRRCSV